MGLLEALSSSSWPAYRLRVRPFLSRVQNCEAYILRRFPAWGDTRNNRDWEQSGAARAFLPLDLCSSPFRVDKQNAPADRFSRCADYAFFCASARVPSRVQSAVTPASPAALEFEVLGAGDDPAREGHCAEAAAPSRREAKSRVLRLERAVPIKADVVGDDGLIGCGRAGEIFPQTITARAAALRCAQSPKASRFSRGLAP
jgi:hypothetical protein